MPYDVNAILNHVSLFAHKKWDELTALMLIRAKPVICFLFVFQSDIFDARKNCHNASETNPLLVPLTYIAGKKATYLGDSYTMPKSCLDVVSKVLANSSDTSSMKSPPESVRHLQS